MNRRSLLQTGSLALGAGLLSASAPSARAGQFTGKIRKSLKWSMIAQRDKLPVLEVFKKLRECGYDGVEPRVAEVPPEKEAEWIAASRESGLVIDGTVGASADDLAGGIDLTKRLGGDSMLVGARYDQKRSIQPQWDHWRDLLRDTAPHAEKQGVKLLVENVWATFLISPFDMARFIDEIGHPFVQVHFDVGNMVRWGVAEHWAEILGKRSQKLDIKEYDLPTHALKEVDIKRAKDAIKNDPFFQAHKPWVKALEMMIKMGVRAEQQALAKHGLNYVMDEYLPRKLKNPKVFLP